MNIKHLIYIVYIILAALVSAGVISCMTSCTAYHSVDSKGITRVITSDTTYISHTGIYKLNH